MQNINLQPFHDYDTPLRNPNKGWYHHLFDNGIDHYLPEQDADLEDFPGLDHIYLRLAWSFLEPERGQFNWRLIDDVIEKWRAKGLTVSFRITCKETDLVYATPQWVKDLGAKGEFFTAWGVETWRPDYDDPIFLEHLDNFHRSFAARYDGQPWVDYIDIGSYGQWGECHNFLSGEKAAPFEVVKQHIDLYLRHYQKTLLCISDDAVGDRTDGRGPELAEYIHDKGITIRDDSVLVRFYVKNYLETFSLRSPKLFQRASLMLPTILELQHYRVMKDPKIDHTWIGRNGEEFGAEVFENAIRLARATWIGYHGDAREWLTENPELTRRLLNLAGYWLFPESTELPELFTLGRENCFSLTWLNRGVAPAYHPYKLFLRLRKGDDNFVQLLVEAKPSAWQPETTCYEKYCVHLPSDLNTGTYLVEISLKQSAQDDAQPILIGLNESMKTDDNFYRIGQIEVVSRDIPLVDRVGEPKDFAPFE